MSYAKIKEKPLNFSKKGYSNGSELIPAEVQANIRHHEVQSIAIPLVNGYTIDDEGLINNFALEPDIYLAAYPSPQQQWQYIVLGEASLFFVIMLLLTAFLVSY